MAHGKLQEKESFGIEEFMEEVKQFFIRYGVHIGSMDMRVLPIPSEDEYGFVKYAIGKRQIVITGDIDWIDKE